MTNYKPVLVHHGILGQKWGVRRYRNEDGTLTEAGKRKYGRRYENRQSKIEQYSKEAAMDEEGSKKLSDKSKKLEKASRSRINREYERLGYYDYDPKAWGYKSKRDWVVSDYKEKSELLKRRSDNKKKEVKTLMNMPINKMSEDEMKKVTKGLNRTVLALNAVGAVALGATLKKAGLSTKDSAKVAGGTALMVQTGAAVINASVRDSVWEKRKNKYGT